jgi:hypothetical protein
MEVRVTNTADRPIEPAFNTVHGDLQTRNYWSIRSGPDTLRAGETATYRIRAQVPQFGPSFGTKTVLAVNDAGTQVQTKEVLPAVLPDDPPEVLNPEIRHWQRDTGDEYFTPYRWEASTSDRGPETASIVERNASAQLRVENATREEGPWAMAGIQQKVDFPETLHVEATPESVVEMPSEHPTHATGVELGEGNHRVWIVFADIEERQIVYRPGEYEYIMVYIPAAEGERVEATVDIADLYRQQDWDQPGTETRTIDGREYSYQETNLLAFAAAYPSYKNESVEVRIHEIRAVE